MADAILENRFDLEAVFLLATEKQRELLHEMLRPNPKLRPSASQALDTVRHWTKDGAEKPIMETKEFFFALGILVLMLVAWIAGF